MSRPRDTQRKRVYDAEHAALDKNWCENLTVEEMQRLVNEWCELRSVRDRYPRAVHVPTVTDGRGRRMACWDPACNQIKMPRWARSKWILCHELAHHLVCRPWPKDPPWHGWEFCECFLFLVRTCVGHLSAAALEREFVKHRVRYRAPRTRTLTAEQREAARQRMLAYTTQRSERRWQREAPQRVAASKDVHGPAARSSAAEDQAEAAASTRAALQRVPAGTPAGTHRADTADRAPAARCAG